MSYTEDVSIGCMMRDAEPYFGRWVAQIEGLVYQLADEGLGLHVVVLENDSRDDTNALLSKFQREFEPNMGSVTVAHLATGAPYWPSVDNPERWRHLGNLCERVRLLQLDTGCPWHVYVECDLIWKPTMLSELLTRARTRAKFGIEAVLSPMLMCAWDHETYYDTWGTVGLDGFPFEAKAPHHSSVSSGDFVEVRSVAGMTILSREALAESSWVDHSNPQAYRTWCESIRESGRPILLSTRDRIFHPKPAGVL